jgi:hypothetical protein
MKLRLKGSVLQISQSNDYQSQWMSVKKEGKKKNILRSVIYVSRPSRSISLIAKTDRKS